MEWVGLMLLVALMGAASLAVAPMVDGRSFGGFLTHRIVCAVRSGGCRDGDAALMASYGARTASLVREHAPGFVYEPGERELPVDYRRCRDPDCANAADDPDLDAHRSAAGARSTVFTRVVRRGGGPTSSIGSTTRTRTAPGGVGPDLEEQCAAPGRRVDPARDHRVPGIPQGRLGGLPGADRRRRPRLGAGHGARPLPGLQAEPLPQPLDSPDGLDPRLTREPRRAHSGAAALAAHRRPDRVRPAASRHSSGCSLARIYTNAPRARRG